MSSDAVSNDAVGRDGVDRAVAPSLRAFAAGDGDAVIALWGRCGLLRPWNDPQRDIARKLTVQPELFIVAVAGDALIGSVMAGFDGHRGWMNYLAVDPAWRRAGVGRTLVAHAEAALQALGCPKVNLQVRRGNEAALAFYRDLGYGEDDVISLGRRLIADG
jgi:ribosomal protein S18 acetylase RimI-like enzyme